MTQVRSINHVKKYWATLLFGTLTTMAIYLTLHSRSHPVTLSPPILTALDNMNQKNTTFEDTLKRWYPVEHAVLDLFPKETIDIISDSNSNDYHYTNKQQRPKQHNTILNTVIMNWLLNRRALPFSWSRYYHSIEKQSSTSQQTSRHPTSYRCQDIPLPYPILRHMVKQVLQLNESIKPNYPIYSASQSPNFNQPFILLPFDTQDHIISTGEPVCIRVIIPPSILNNNHPTTPFHYRYQPYSRRTTTTTTPDDTYKAEYGEWWDMMQIFARQLSTNASIPFNMTPWDGHKTLHDAYQKKWFEHENNIPNWSRRMMEDMDERGWLHVYETDAVWMDPGQYLLDGKLEFQDAYWNTDLGPVQPYHPLPLPVEPWATLWVQKMGGNEITTTAATDVKQLVLEHLELPLCKGGHGDHSGRWLPWPFSDLVDASRMVIGLDKHGKFWAPFLCRYRPLSHQQFHRCLARRFPRGMNIYGDSNMRRSIKSFLSHGQWCKDYYLYNNNGIYGNSHTRTTTFTTPRYWEYLGEPSQLRACHCEDFKEVSWNPAWFNATARRCDVVFENMEDETRQLGQQTEWDMGSGNDMEQQDGIRVSSYKWDGLTFMNDQGWQAVFTQPAYALPSNTDLVVISLVNWDMAYMQLEEFYQALDLLVQHLKTQYDNNNSIARPLFIYRTPQYYCCRVDQTNRQRKSNTARMRIFDQVARQAFQAAFSNQHWVIWDVMMMGEARTWDEKMETVTCGANHAPADVIHLENQVLMNALCNPS